MKAKRDMNFLPMSVGLLLPRWKGMHASDELTMDSALIKSGSNQNLKEQEEEEKRAHEKENVHQEQHEQEEQERAAITREKTIQTVEKG